jgi:DNA-binding MarR family transcriptional regulator
MEKENEIDVLYSMVGHLIRRSHQISVAMFLQKNANVSITPVQFAALWGVRSYPGIDQLGLSKKVGIDRTTIGNVLLRLADRGLITRRADESDRRVKVLCITDEGSRLLDASEGSVQNSQDQFLAPLSGSEKTELIRLLGKIVKAHNGKSRAPTD